MKLLLQSAMIFFGTLMAAGVVALGEPAKTDSAGRAESAAQPRASSLRSEVAENHRWADFASVRTGFGLR